MKKLFTLLLVLAAWSTGSQGVSINFNGSPPDPSAGLDVNFTNKGLLMPRLSLAQRNGISNPAAGLQIYDTTTNCFEFYTGSYWQAIVCACLVPPSMPGNISGPAVYCVNQTAVYSIAPVASATSYVWAVPPDATIISGQGTTSITVGMGSSSGNAVSVYAQNTCGIGNGNSLTVSSLSTAPSNPGAISGINSVLTNQTGVSFAIDTVSNTSYYNWSVPGGASIASGQGTNSISVNFGASSGNVCVIDSDACGSSSSQCLSVNVSANCPAHNTITFAAVGVQQSYTVPSCVSSITIAAYGAQGGNSSNGYTGGYGAYMQGTFNVNPGDVLTVGVGQHPGGSNGSFQGGGGGGSSGVKDGNTVLIVAGGGGGAGGNHTDFSTSNAVTGTSGQSVYGCANGSTLIAAGGTGGNGGQAGTDVCNGNWPEGGGGGGVLSNGANPVNDVNFATNGPAGGSSSGAGGAGDNFQGCGGGFGFTGGGGASYTGGGGGGYSGGAGGGTLNNSYIYSTGGGGGSYNAGSSQTNSAGYQTGDGMVVISW